MKYQLSTLFQAKWNYLLEQGCKLINDEIVGGVFKRKFECKTSDGKITGILNEFGRVEWHNEQEKE